MKVNQITMMKMMKFSDEYVYINECEKIINEFAELDNTVIDNKRVQYYNFPCAFDIETSSLLCDGEKFACCYFWSFCLNGGNIIGRTWEEFITLCERLQEKLELSENKILIVYIQNLAYEYQFFRKRLKWLKVFALKEREVVYCLCDYFILFKCSFILSGKPLSKIADDLVYYKVKKLVGDLDYNKVRHSKTPMTEKEIIYGVRDSVIVCLYIAEKIYTDGDILKIPLTKTGYVRNYCRNLCFYKNEKGKKDKYKYRKYKAIIKSLTITADDYLLLKNAFQGGFTHANAFNSNKVFYKVGSFDFTSSYPAVMVAEKFPMSSPFYAVIRDEKTLNHYLQNYNCVFDISFENLCAKTIIDNPLSLHKCQNTKNVETDNGRVISADYLTISITEVDFDILKNFYEWSNFTIGKFMYFYKGYLPTDFIRSILYLYRDKTILKNIEGKEFDYLLSKEMLNSCYGMTVTDICRDIISYDDDLWTSMPCDYCEAVEKYNKSSKRFLFYAWGIYVTAYARKNLFGGILEFGNDYIYSDTDSIKALNINNHMDYINDYNKKIEQKLKIACDYHKISYDLISPVNAKNQKKTLGVWEFEGTYQVFKTLGAKRYMTLSDYSLSITVAGVNKKYAVPYLIKKYGKYGAFKAFTNDLYIPPDYTGKNTHTYIDDKKTKIITDYFGVSEEVTEYSYIHLAKCDFTLSLSQDYIYYLLGVQKKEV